MKEDTRKCPNCGEGTSLVGYIDKDSKEDIGIEPTENFRMPGGFLSGTLRRYKCPNGHETTNEEPENKGEVDSFEDAEMSFTEECPKRFIDYVEFLTKTQKPIIFRHLLYLEFLAGWGTAKNINEFKDLMEEKRPLPIGRLILIADARERLSQGLVPKNWLELFNKQINEQN